MEFISELFGSGSESTVLALLGAISLVLIIYAIWPKGRNDHDALMRRMGGGGDQDPTTIQRRQQEGTAKAMAKRVSRMAKPVMPKSQEAMSKLRLKMASAGYRSEAAFTIFLGSKTICGLGCAAIGFIVGLGLAETNVHLAGMAMFGGGLGMMLPNVWLSMAVSERSKKIREGLPDTLDLMVISVEAGLGLDAALLRVGEEMTKVHPALAEEMMLATAESQMGVPRGEALEHMAARSGVGEMKSLVAVVNQAERFGTSIAKALRNQAQVLRTKRRQAAEERAQKTAVKLMIPLVLFIFPAIFIVLVGPAALQLIRTLGQQAQ